MIKNTLCRLVSIVALAACALPPTISDSAAASGVERQSTKHAKFLILAEQGHGSAQLVVAQDYALGDGVARDAARADRWFDRAAATDPKLIRLIFQFHASRKNNITRAANWFARLPKPVRADDMMRIARRYLYAKPGQRSAGKALDFFTRAAEQGAAEAHEYIGTMYFQGLGVKKDYAVARRHFLQSPSPLASAYPLGVMNILGLGMDRNIRSARLWLEVAARSGHPIAASKFAELYASTDPITGANRLNAFTWHLVAASLGSMDSRRRAMRLYMDLPLEMGLAAKAKAARIMAAMRPKTEPSQLPH
jgi:hypothetical protein